MNALHTFVFLGLAASFFVPTFGFIGLASFLREVYKKPFAYIIAAAVSLPTHFLFSYITIKIQWWGDEEMFNYHIYGTEDILGMSLPFIVIFGITVLCFERNLILRMLKIIPIIHRFMKK